MAAVQASRRRKYEYSSFGEEPTEHIESEGDILIRDLCAKQLDTNCSLDQFTKQEKHFERGSGFVPLSAHTAGSSTLQDVKTKVLKEEYLEELGVLGLTPIEANAVLNGEDLTFPDSKVETSIKEARARQIREIIAKRNSNHLKDKKQESDNLSRHEKELALAVKPKSTETKLFQFALSCQNDVTRDIRPLDHPINHLDALEKTLFAHYDPVQAANTVRRKRRQLLDASLPPQGPKYMKTQEEKCKPSLWDQEVKPERKMPKKFSNPRSCTNRNPTLYTIKNGKIVEVNEKNRKELFNSKKDSKNDKELFKGTPFVSTISQPNLGVDKHDTEPQKLTTEEIRNMTRFKDYEKGLPSKVLYVKNLNKNVEEEDLVKLFNRFQRPGEPSIIYRLMSGKMRGQAFITFSDSTIAEKALDTLNGSIIKEKPIIIAFGKS